MLLMNGPVDFEWDQDKARLNLAKHGVPFEAAVDVFLDDDRLDWTDDRFDYGEERRVAIGTVDGLCLAVAYTLRGAGTARIISARRANRKERARYGDHS